jgi:hypothetical protein
MSIRPSMRENARFPGKAAGAQACQQTRRARPIRRGLAHRAGVLPDTRGIVQDLLLYIMYIIGT